MVTAVELQIFFVICAIVSASSISLYLHVTFDEDGNLRRENPCASSEYDYVVNEEGEVVDCSES